MEMCHNATRLVLISPSKLKVWRFQEEAYVDAYNDGPNEANSKWDTPGGGIIDAFRLKLTRFATRRPKVMKRRNPLQIVSQ
jgi:hypothetical protein